MHPSLPITVATSTSGRVARSSAANVVVAVAGDGNTCPDQFHHSEGPGPRQEPVGARQHTPERKEQHEPTMPPLQGIHRHHERQGYDTVSGDHGAYVARSARQLTNLARRHVTSAALARLASYR